MQARWQGVLCLTIMFIATMIPYREFGSSYRYIEKKHDYLIIHMLFYKAKGREAQIFLRDGHLPQSRPLLQIITQSKPTSQRGQRFVDWA
jgi:hypothetical protein